jgi:DNA replication protein DnaC
MQELKGIKPILEKLLKTSASKTPNESFEYACPACLDTGWVTIEGKGAKWCECLKSKRYSQLIERIPPEYRPITLANVQPQVKRHPKQAAVLDAIKEDPSMSLLLSGRVGSGKSLIGWLLYRHAIEAGRPVAALPLSELLAQFRRYECGGDTLPAITAENLRVDTPRWFVFLDEFDKARPSEFASEQLFLLMDAVYTYRHQLVVTSNLGKDELREHWAKTSEQYGASIMRRLLELDGITRVGMFDEPAQNKTDNPTASGPHEHNAHGERN